MKKKEFSIGEDDAANSLVVNVCVGLTGNFTNPVTVQLQTQPGSTSGRDPIPCMVYSDQQIISYLDRQIPAITLPLHVSSPSLQRKV